MSYNSEQVLEIVKKVTSFETDKISLLGPIEDIITNKLPEAMKKNAPLNYPELYKEFTDEYSRLKEFILFRPLIGKRIIALGGAFSSGKSSFLNSMIKQQNAEAGGEQTASILPEDVNPSTSVPTYIVRSDAEEAQSINIFDTVTTLDVRDVEPIAHGFGRGSDVRDEGICLGQLLKTVFVKTPYNPFENIAFLDTPGYSKPGSTPEKSDEWIAREQLASSDGFIWFVNQDKGLTKEDIKFLKSFDHSDKKKILVITRADKKIASELEEIREHVKSTCIQNGLEFDGVFLFSKNNKKPFDRGKIKNWLADRDMPVEEANFAFRFSRLFLECRDYFSKETENEQKRLGKLNIALAKADIKEIDELVKESKEKIKMLKDISNGLDEIKANFFVELRRIGSVLGIKFPTEESIEEAYKRMKEAAATPLDIAEECLREKGLTRNEDILDVIMENLGVTPYAAQSESDKIFEAICGALPDIPPADRGADIYGAIFGGLSGAAAAENASDRYLSCISSALD